MVFRAILSLTAVRRMAPRLLRVGVFASALGSAVSLACAGVPVVGAPSRFVAVVPSPGREVPMREVVIPFAQPRMRVARENPSARTPPLLPQVVAAALESSPTPSPTPAETADAKSDPAAASSKTVISAATIIVENPSTQALDFFREAAVRASGGDAEGTIFDPTFQPAQPPPQPTSSATYELVK